jgi:hypothetical protein
MLQKFFINHIDVSMKNSLNDKQKQILKALQKQFGKDLDVWMSTPNRLFRNRTPFDLLMSGCYEYFSQFVNVTGCDKQQDC